MDIDKLLLEANELFKDSESLLTELDEVTSEIERVHEIAVHTEEILDDLDKQFEQSTGLTKTDTKFLFLAIGLQISRQYLLSNEKCRVSAKDGDKFMKNALNTVAPPSYVEILTSSVPYDVIKTGEHVRNTGLAGTTHRYRTLGHDPILGWIFGTANIMTNSLTKTNFETYSVKNNQMTKHYPNGVTGMLEKAVQYSADDPKLLTVAVARQAIHFGSDYFTKQGLPVPVIATVDNQLAQKMLSNWHIDMWSITRGASLSILINQLISVMHTLFYSGNTEQERKLYEVRTRKILSYSNAVATSSNVAVVAITKDMKKLDVGGMAVTIYRLISDQKFIREVKEDFINDSYKTMIMGDNL